VPFKPDFVFSGIGKQSKLLAEGVDFTLTKKGIRFEEAPGCLIDCYAGSAWPERFTRDEMEKRRRETRTVNEWDSQYQLHSKPVSQIRLDPDWIIPYDVEPVIRYANRTASMWLGKAKIAGMSARWDPASGKIRSDVSAFALVLQDEYGRRYLHRMEQLTGEVAQFTEDGKRIIGGQVFQICELVQKFSIPRITVETNGIGGFAPAVLKAALKQRKLICGVSDELAIENKNKRILEAYEGPMSSGMMWGHSSVLDGPFRGQMKDFNPETKNNADDYLDAGAGAITDTPERINVRVVEAEREPDRHNWRGNSGVHEYEFSRDSA
jgi:hypothetical protein